MQFEGDRFFAKPVGEVWEKLRDARFLVECIPEAFVQGQPELDRAACTVRPGLAFVRGTIEVAIQVTEAVQPSSVRFSLLSKGIGSSSDVEANLAISSHDGGAKVHWTAEVKSLGGLLKAVPAGLIRGAAQKVIEDVWQTLEKKLNAEP